MRRYGFLTVGGWSNQWGQQRSVDQVGWQDSKRGIGRTMQENGRPRGEGFRGVRLVVGVGSEAGDIWRFMNGFHHDGEQSSEGFAITGLRQERNLGLIVSSQTAKARKCRHGLWINLDYLVGFIWISATVGEGEINPEPTREGSVLQVSVRIPPP